jgi:thymidine phosphorylase
VNGYEIGMSVVMLRGGRQRKDDAIDPSVGLRWLGRIGQEFEPGELVAEILAPPGFDTEPVVRRLQAALGWSDAPVSGTELLLGRLG